MERFEQVRAPVERVARVAVEQTAISFDKLYDYRIPVEWREQLCEGCRVLVPFGTGNHRRQGIVVEISEDCSIGKIKPVVAVLDKAPLLSKELLLLGSWIAEKNYCPRFDAYKAMLPAGIGLRIIVTYAPAPDLPVEREMAMTPQEHRLLEFLRAARGPVEKSRLLESLGLSPDDPMPDRLSQEGFLNREDDSVRRIQDAVIKMVRLAVNEEEARTFLAGKVSAKQRQVVQLLLETGGASVKETCYFAACTPAVITALERRGVVEYYVRETFRNPIRETSAAGKGRAELTDEQGAAFERLLAQMQAGGGTALLYGVTGSGKTQVFMRLADEVIAAGKAVIVMVPEISLTPQTIQLFYRRYGDRVAVMHSGLSLGERLDEWKRIRMGKAQIVIGTRSAVFAPVEKLGLVVLDEEQESTYKSESTPRYHARDVARFRAAYHKALLVLSSATPSLESYYQAREGKYTLCRLTRRYGEAHLPETMVADLRLEPPGTGQAISAPLLAALEENLQKGEQSILLLNRRGYHTFASCRACGEVAVCPNCSISMTYHSANRHLMCHYCGHIEPLATKCRHCGEEQMQYTGFGTQRLEEELAGRLPGARLLRLDADTTMSRFAHEEKFARFSRGDYDILLGTQMVAKGLDFPNVTLVGVISADQALFGDDYRSYERAFSLLTQVVGRSGRGSKKGRAIIQTFTPDHPVLALAARQDYEGFYKSEIAVRRGMLYPPFCDICMIGFVGPTEEKTESAARLFTELLRQQAEREFSNLPLRVLGPAPAPVSKVSGKYRYRLLIKCRDHPRLRELIRGLLTRLGRERGYDDVTVYADLNPEGML